MRGVEILIRTAGVSQCIAVIMWIENSGGKEGSYQKNLCAEVPINFLRYISKNYLYK